MSRHWKVAVDEFLSTHLGVISATPTRELRVVRAEHWRTSWPRAELITMLPGVFRSAQWPCNREQVLAAVCARNPAAMIGFTTAGQLWVWRRMTDPIDPCSGSSRSLAGDGGRRRSPLPPNRSGRHRAARRRDPTDESAANDLRQRRHDRRRSDSLGTRAAPQRAVGPRSARSPTPCNGCTTRAVPGRRTMLAVIRSRPAWRAALQSDLEVRVLDEMSRQDLPVPTTQFPMRLPGYDHDIAIDFAWPNVKLAVEVDHPAWHAGAVDSHADKGRDRKLDDDRVDVGAHHRHRRQRRPP